MKVKVFKKKEANKIYYIELFFLLNYIAISVDAKCVYYVEWNIFLFFFLYKEKGKLLWEKVWMEIKVRNYYNYWENVCLVIIKLLD